jgi:hypothetical protein
MPPISEAELRVLRQKYQAAYTAYQSCVDALAALAAKRETPSAELLEKEGKALRELNEARAAYRDALMDIAFTRPILPASAAVARTVCLPRRVRPFAFPGAR